MPLKLLCKKIVDTYAFSPVLCSPFWCPSGCQHSDSSLPQDQWWESEQTISILRSQLGTVMQVSLFQSWSFPITTCLLLSASHPHNAPSPTPIAPGGLFVPQWPHSRGASPLPWVLSEWNQSRHMAIKQLLLWLKTAHAKAGHTHPETLHCQL